MAEITMDVVEKKFQAMIGEAGNAKANAEVICEYLRGRCNEDMGMREDIVQGHKTWKRLNDYLYKKASKLPRNGNMACVRDNVVFEWCEDYFRKDDKKEAEEEAAKKKAQDEKMKAAKENAKAVQPEKKVEEKPAEKPAEKLVEKKQKGQIEGQMDLFSMLGMG